MHDVILAVMNARKSQLGRGAISLGRALVRAIEEAQNRMAPSKEPMNHLREMGGQSTPDIVIENTPAVYTVVNKGGSSWG